MKLPFLVRKVEGKSMLPTIKSGDFLFAKRSNRITTGNVVILKVNNREIIKRVSKINKSKVYVLGDNPSASTDSRSFGWVETDKIIAKIIWPQLNIKS